MGAAMRYQPQGLARLNRSNPLTVGAQAIISAAQSANLVSLVPLKNAGTITQGLSTNGKVYQFRKNGYVETETLPAIGTASFVEFWCGVPSADRYAKGNSSDPGFLTGSGANQIGIIGSVGSNQSSANPGQWGAIRDWGSNNRPATGEVLAAGVWAVLVVVRRQSGMEFWHNGTLVYSYPGAPVSYSAQTMICGSFVEDTGYWPSSSDTMLAGRIASEWTADQVKQFSANPWQLFDAGSSSSAYQAAIASAGVAPTGVAISGAWLEQNDSAHLAASASVVESTAWTEAPDALAASLLVAATASAAWAEASDALSISGAAAAQAAISWSEASDSLVATVAAKVSASAAISEANDGALIQSAASIAASVALIEANDIAALSASVGSAVAIIANWAESSDIASVAASARIAGSATWAEASDSAALAATVGSAVAASVQWIEASDAAVISAQASVTAAASWTEASDIAALAATAGNAVAATAALVEQSDACAVLATVRVSASAGWAEAADMAGFSASVLASAGISWVEGADALHASASVNVSPAAVIAWLEDADQALIHAVSSALLAINPRQLYIAKPRIRKYVGH